MQPQTQQTNPFGGTFGGDVAVRQNAVLRNTYWLLALTLIPTAIGAVVGTSLIDFSFMRGGSTWMWAIGIIAVFYGWIYAIEKNRDSGLGVALLLGFTLFMGLLLGPLLQRVLGLSNGAQLVAMAAGGTAAVFFALSAVATNAKRDFSNLGKFLVVGAVVIMLAVLANIFLQSPVLHLVLVSVFIIFSSLVILWQLNSIVRGGETNYVSATLSLYVAIYNIFTSLLQLLGIFGGDRD
jgi:modulator of FtsH protease